MEDISFETLINNTFYMLVTNNAHRVMTDTVIQEITDTFNKDVDAIYARHNRVRASRYEPTYISFIIHQMHDMNIHEFKFPDETHRKPLPFETDHPHEVQEGNKTANTEQKFTFVDDVDQYDTPDPIVMKEGDDRIQLVGNMDADVWADAFIKLLTKHPKAGTDVETVRSWFANAILTGWDRAIQTENPYFPLKEGEGYYLELLDKNLKPIYNLRFVTLASLETWITNNDKFFRDEKGMFSYQVYTVEAKKQYL